LIQHQQSRGDSSKPDTDAQSPDQGWSNGIAASRPVVHGHMMIVAGLGRQDDEALAGSSGARARRATRPAAPYRRHVPMPFENSGDALIERCGSRHRLITGMTILSSRLD
jgi:hypothetical protein